MEISPENSDRLSVLIKRLYSRRFDESLVLETAESACKIVGGHYFALYLFREAQRDTPLFISNNPPDFIPVYLSVLEKDFLMKALVETGHEYVWRRDPEYDAAEHGEFVQAVQNARPISDIVYNPLLTDGAICGYWALGRAGHSGPVYSDSDLELFRFIVGFLNDAFQRTFFPKPAEEDIAYLDRDGRVVSSGARIAEALSDLFGRGRAIAASACRRNHELFLRRYERFLRGPAVVGLDRVFLQNEGREYSFLLESVDFGGIDNYKQGPRAALRLLTGKRESPLDSLLDPARLARLYGLTPRECDVVLGIYQAKSNKAIAGDLHIDESTVKRHTHNIYEKTGLRSRVELVQGLSFG